MTFSKKTTPLHSTEPFKIFFSLLTLSTAFLQKAGGPGKNFTITLTGTAGKVFSRILNSFSLEKSRE